MSGGSCCGERECGVLPFLPLSLISRKNHTRPLAISRQTVQMYLQTLAVARTVLRKQWEEVTTVLHVGYLCTHLGTVGTQSSVSRYL